MALAPLIAVVAVADNGVMGKDGGLPWRIPEDLRHFKRETLGHAIIMGRRTWDERGKPLPGRRNIVVSRTVSALEGGEVARTLEEAVALARETDPEPRIVGGAELFRAAMPIITKWIITEIHRDVAGDTFLPEWDRSDFVETERRLGVETPDIEFVTWERRS